MTHKHSRWIAEFRPLSPDAAQRVESITSRRSLPENASFSVGGIEEAAKQAHKMESKGT